MRVIKRLLAKSNLFLLGFVIFFIPFYFLLYKFYLQRLNSFGCFDDCFNYGAGYFLLHGKRLYSEIFFNHQPLMAYLSFLIQRMFHIQDMFQLLLRHRQIEMLYYFFWAILLTKRFRLSGALAVITYEISKFFLFGERFLAEGLIVYPMMYLLGLVWYTLKGNRLHTLEYIWCGLLAWIIVFARGPYAPAALVALLCIVWKPTTKPRIFTLVVFALLSIITLSILPLQDYWRSVFTISSSVASSETAHTNILGLGVLQVFCYPLFIFFTGSMNAFRVLLIGYALTFVCALVLVLWKKPLKAYRNIGILLFLLGLMNLRPINPGTQFYAAFHMLVWYGSFLLLTHLLLAELAIRKKILLRGVLVAATAVYLFLARDYLFNNINPHVEFVTNFGTTYGLGQTVRILSTSQNTFFMDGYDDLILAYPQSQRISPYQYSWYVYVARGNKLFDGTRRHMLATNPPDFYYGRRWRVYANNDDSSLYRDMYTRVNYYGKPGDLYIKNSIYETITSQQWESVEKYGYGKTKDTEPPNQQQIPLDQL